MSWIAWLGLNAEYFCDGTGSYSCMYIIMLLLVLHFAVFLFLFQLLRMCIISIHYDDLSNDFSTAIMSHIEHKLIYAEAEY